MQSLPLRKEDLLKYRNDRDIVHKTALQVQKDFATFGFDVQLPVDLHFAYDDLFDQLSPVIRHLLAINATKLYSLLYTIDLSENAIHKGLSEMSDMEIHEAITHLVLERELKKVLTRAYFSRNF